MGNTSSILKPRYLDGVSMGADAVGDWLNIRGISKVSFQIVWTTSAGSPIGVWRVQVSNDGPAGGQPSGSTPSGNLGPTDLTLTTAQIASYPAGSAGDTVLEFVDMSENWIRFWYDRTSGTGTINVGASGKGF